GDPVGAGRAVVASAARGHADHRQRAPEPAVRLPRVLRLPAVLPGKRAAGGGRRAAGGLAAAVSTRWARYVAVGDSMTEGLWDPYSTSGGTAAGGVQAVAPEAVDSPAEPGEAPLRGWADRLALALSERRIADGGAPLEYANLAVRGRLLGPILDAQLPAALKAGADLVSVVGGGNDLLRPNADPDRLAARLERGVRAARETGADVLLATGTDTRRAPLLAAIRPKVAVYNAHIWSIARRNGAYVLDVWGLRALRDWRMWAEDRIHLSSEGHHRVAQA